MIRINLDMDMPEECHECPFQLKFKDGEADTWYMRRCVIVQRKIEYPRPEWCPLEYVSERTDDTEHDGRLMSTKEQVRVEPLFSERMRHFVCPCCSLVLDELRDDYCPSCGKQIAWNEYYIHEDDGHYE